jgi:hypothetical protein
MPISDFISCPVVTMQYSAEKVMSKKDVFIRFRPFTGVDEIDLPAVLRNTYLNAFYIFFDTGNVIWISLGAFQFLFMCIAF